MVAGLFVRSPHAHAKIKSIDTGAAHAKPGVLAVHGADGIRALLAFVLVSYARGYLPKLATRSLIIGGPLGDASAFPALLAGHESIAVHQAVLSQIRNLDSPSDRSVFEAMGYTWEDHLNYVIDLEQTESALLGKMSKSRRKSIAAADRSGVHLLEPRDPKQDTVYRLLRETYLRAKVPLAPRNLFESALSVLLPRGQLWCVLAAIGETSCAVRLVLRWRNTLYDWYAGSSELGRQYHADAWLVWQILRRGIAEGCTRFDFGGAGAPQENYGPAEFKRRFGGRTINPGRFERIYRPIASRLTKTAYGLWRQWH